MNLLSLSLFLGVAACLSVSAADPAFDWVSSGGGAKNDKTRAICFDATGHVLVAGEMTGDSTFGEHQVKSAGGMDFVLARLNQKGRCLWVRSIGGSQTDRGYGVATDAALNIYVTGHFQSTDATANGKPLPNAGDYDIFVAKYDSSGNLLWIRTAGGKGYDYGHGIAVDGNGDVMVSGAIVGEVKFGDTVLAGDGRSIFCAKYGADGELKWAKRSSGKASGSGHGIGVDAAHNIYVAGSVNGEGRFGNVPLSPEKGQSTLLLKLAANGDAIWAKTTPGGGIHEISVGADGRVWVAGMFKGQATIGDAQFQTTSDTDSDGLLIHYSTTGDIQWSRVFRGPKTDYCLGVATDDKGTAFVTGEFSETATFAGRTLTAYGATDIYVAALSETGELQWIVQAGGTKGDNAYTMDYHPGGHLVIGGACVGPARFGIKEMPATQGPDLYGARISLP